MLLASRKEKPSWIKFKKILFWVALIAVLICIGKIAWRCYVNKICTMATDMAARHLADKYETEMELLETDYVLQVEGPHWVTVTFCPADNHELRVHVYVFQKRFGEHDFGKIDLFLPEEKQNEERYFYADDYLMRKCCYEMEQRYRESISSIARTETNISLSSAVFGGNPYGYVAKSPIDEAMSAEELEKSVYYYVAIKQLSSSSPDCDVLWDLWQWVSQNGYTPKSFDIWYGPEKKLLTIKYDELNAMKNYSDFLSYMGEALQ